MSEKKIEFFTDGASRGNPGESSWAFFCKENGHTTSGYLGRATNNQAEYTAIIEALTYRKENYSNSPAIVYTDSLLIANQLNGVYKVSKLRKLFEHANRLSDSTEFVWIPRENNKIADSLCNKVLNDR